MKIYIAYKYTHVVNKEELIKSLENISHKLASYGFETFLLGRDVKKWQDVHYGSIKLIPIIYHNMQKCDALLIYVNSNSFSKGLFFEAVISWILNKKSILFLKEGCESNFFKFIFGKTIVIKDENDITLDKLVTISQQKEQLVKL